jgi:hypothetical protein
MSKPADRRGRKASGLRETDSGVAGSAAIRRTVILEIISIQIWGITHSQIEVAK